MTVDEMREELKHVKFLDYSFEIILKNELPFLRASYEEVDIVTGKIVIQKTRKWYVSEHATLSEFIQTAFKCALTSMEHRTRENFKWNGKRIFSPHFDLRALWAMCNDRQFDYRKPIDAGTEVQK